MSKIREWFGLETPEMRSEISLDRLTKWSDWLDWKYDGQDPYAGGGPMNERGALAIPAFWCAVRAITETISTLPLETTITDGDGDKQPAKDDAVYWILKNEPNVENTKVEALEAYIGPYVSTGNGFVWIDWSPRGELKGYHNLSNDRVEVKRENDALIYEVKKTDTGKVLRVPYPTGNIGHLKAFGNGTVGYSPIEYHAGSALGVNVQAYRYRAAMFANGGSTKGFLTTPAGTNFDEKILAERKKSWTDAVRGASNAGNTAFLPGGWTYQNIQLSPVDLMLIQDLQLSGQDIARIMRVAPWELYYVDNIKFSNAEQMVQDFVKKTIRPHATRIEAAMERDFLTSRQRHAGYQIKFNMDALLRGDSLAQAQVFEILGRNGFLQINEVRAFLDRNKVEGGDANMVQGQMANIATGKMLANEESNTEAAPKTTPKPAKKEQKTSSNGADPVQNRVIEAIHDILYAAVERMHNKARAELRTKLQRQETLKDAERVAERFFTEHESFCVDVLTPPVKAAAKALASEEMTEERIRSLVKDRVGRHIKGLRGVLSLQDSAADMAEEIANYNVDALAEVASRGILAEIEKKKVSDYAA